MNYFKLLEEGNILKFTYNKSQTDGFGNQWTTETWKKINSSQYTCEYDDDCLELDTSTFDQKDAEIFMKENTQFETRKEMTVEIIDNKCNGVKEVDMNLDSCYLQRQRILNSIKFIELAISEINDSEYIDECDLLYSAIYELNKDVRLWNQKIKDT